MSINKKVNGLKKSAGFLEGKTKIGLDDVIARFPEKVTIRNIAIINDEKHDSKYVAMTCDEMEGYFFFGGSVIAKAVQEIVAELYEGSIKAFATEVNKEGWEVKFELVRSKNGNTYHKVISL